MLVKQAPLCGNFFNHFENPFFSSRISKKSYQPTKNKKKNSKDIFHKIICQSFLRMNFFLNPSKYIIKVNKRFQETINKNSEILFEERKREETSRLSLELNSLTLEFSTTNPQKVISFLQILKPCWKKFVPELFFN